MKNKSAKYLVSVVLCLYTLLFSGCVKFYHYEKIPIKVIDPELNQPVEGATVSVNYYLSGGGFFLPKSPKDLTTYTDANGSAKLKSATNLGVYSWYSNIEAEGYIPVQFPNVYEILYFYSNIKTNKHAMNPYPIRVENEEGIIIPLYRKLFCFRRNWTFPEIELVCISMKGNERCQTNGKSFHRSKKYSYCGFI